MKFAQFVLAAAVIVPAFAFAAPSETWKLEGVNSKATRDHIVKSVERSNKGATVTLDDAGILNVSVPNGDVNKNAVARALPKNVKATTLDTSTTTTTTTTPAAPVAPGTTTTQEKTTTTTPETTKP